MAMARSRAIAPSAPGRRVIAKAPRGNAGLDELAAGGLPAGRRTLIAGGPRLWRSSFGLETCVAAKRDDVSAERAEYEVALREELAHARRTEATQVAISSQRRVQVPRADGNGAAHVAIE